MTRSLCRMLVLLLPLPVLAEMPVRVPSDTAELDHRLAAATWPDDIVQLAEACLARTGRNACNSPAAELRQQASAARQILARGEVKLPRSAFEEDSLPGESRADIRKAALGDGKAAGRVGRAYQLGAMGSVAANEPRYVAWLQLASLLGDDIAAYDLALYFRAVGQPAQAAIYESRATALGFKPPAALDNIRK